MNTRNTIVSLCHSKVRSSQNKGIPFFSCLNLVLYFMFKTFSGNSNLTNFFDVKRSHEKKNELNICVSNEVYSLF